MTTKSASKQTVASRLTAGSAHALPKQPRKRGRFREKDPDKLSDKAVRVYVTEAERVRIKRLARDLAGTSVSNFGRKCMLGTDVASKADLRVVSQLSQHFCLVKKLISDLDGIKSREDSKATLSSLVELRDAIKASLIVINESFSSSKFERKGAGK